MRAPPEAETTISGVRVRCERSMARVIFSPITAPMLPPMNLGSMAQMWTVAPFEFPDRRKSARLSATSRPAWLAAAPVYGF